MDPSAVNDPFADYGDVQRTFIRPNPGGRPAAAPVAEVTQHPGAAAADAAVPEHGLNPLLALANRVLMAVPSLRTTRHVDDVAGLRNSLAQGIRDFHARATALGTAPEQALAARYVLCTLLDEVAANTPWGNGVWVQHSLSAMFHNDTKGGEKVFQLMARFAEKPAVNRDVLEVIYAALALGFEGRYRLLDNGHAQLDAVRDKLAQVLRQVRGEYPRALAQHWQGQNVSRRIGRGWLPLAAAAAVALLLLIGVYLGLLFSLAGRAEPVYAQIQSLRLTPPVVAPPQPAAKPRVAQFLQADIKARTVDVRDELDRSVITVRGDGTFAPGSATLMHEHEALIGRIAQALAQVGGSVLVTGHTDNQPIARSARFPSNWHLSEQRAKSVRDLLVAGSVPADRIRAEGRADGEPVVANDTPGNRALNRRVEITLFVAGAPSAAPQAPAAPASGAPR